MTIARDQVHKILCSAEQEVRILGVVAADIDWETVAVEWAQRFRDSSTLRVTILCESDNMLFSKAFTYDAEMASTRRTFRELRFIRDRALELPQLLLASGAPSESVSGTTSRLQINIVHLNVPLSIVQVDGQTLTNMWLHEFVPAFEEIRRDHPRREFIESYVNAYFDPRVGLKYSCTAKGEVLELFDHERIPRGIYPRASFYDTDYSQLVVWALVFDRRGRLLIHRRSPNASDNRGMWDKSVGGHVDFRVDIDTSRAVLREVIEELFSEEVKTKTDFTAWTVSDEEMIYLGEWRPIHRRRLPFSEINGFRREWTFFRLRNSQHLYSPRILPDGRTRRLRVISDVFVFVAGTGLGDESLGQLKNSQFKLVELADLKNALDKALRDEPVAGFDDINEVPLFTPDLTNIMTGELRDSLEEFSQYIKRYVSP